MDLRLLLLLLLATMLPTGFHPALTCIPKFGVHDPRALLFTIGLICFSVRLRLRLRIGQLAFSRWQCGSVYVGCLALEERIYLHVGGGCYHMAVSPAKCRRRLSNNCLGERDTTKSGTYVTMSQGTKIEPNIDEIQLHHYGFPHILLYNGDSLETNKLLHLVNLT